MTTTPAQPGHGARRGPRHLGVHHQPAAPVPAGLLAGPEDGEGELDLSVQGPPGEESQRVFSLREDDDGVPGARSDCHQI